MYCTSLCTYVCALLADCWWVLGSRFVRSFGCRSCVLSIADCGLLVWVVADCGFQRTEGQKFGRASSSKRGFGFGTAADGSRARFLGLGAQF
ncbi:unnamed protein product [Sphagnum troendelagicum]|uniref:Secreted protein n=1 Tax=Sphagnum troendelagicum TaxID=128251 RepID=A0ABP0UDL6_9BRYO